MDTQAVKIDGLAKESKSMITNLFSELRSDMDREFGELRKDMQTGFTQTSDKVSGLDTRLARVETSLLSMPGTAKMYLAIGTALLLGLGGVFAMFKYIFAPIH